MGQNTCWLIDELMPLRFGAVSRTGYRSEGVTVRPFLESERHHGGGFVQFHHGQRIFEVVLDAEALDGCPVALYLVGLHESGHVINGDWSPGKNALRLTESDSKTQERRAWQFVQEAAPKVTVGKPDHIEHCLNNCVGLKETPTRCTAPDLSGLLEQLGKAGRAGGPSLKEALEKKIKASAAWFRKAAKGLKGADGKAILARKKYPANVTRKHRPARGTEGRVVSIPRKSSRILEGRAFKNMHLSERCGGRIERPISATDSMLGANGGKLYVKKYVNAATGEVLDLR